MRILIDIVHPAHVHFYRHMITEFHRRGHETTVVARDKDVTIRLLDAFGIPHRVVGQAGARRRSGQLRELLQRILALFRIAKSSRSEIILTRNPAGTVAAYLARIPSVFDTDDGLAAGVHFSLGKLFATTITSPESLGEDHGPKHRRYRGYKATAYLHPRYFRPNPSVLELLGVKTGDRYFIMRLVAMNASHDHGESGLTRDAILEVARRLKNHGRLFVSAEAGVLPELAADCISVPPHRMHDALAFADMVVGDSQTMAIEATLLGTPSIRVSTFAGRLACLEYLQEEYGLPIAFQPTEVPVMLDALDSRLKDPSLRLALRGDHERLLRETVDVTEWYLQLVHEISASASRLAAKRSSP